MDQGSPCESYNVIGLNACTPVVSIHENFCINLLAKTLEKTIKSPPG